MSSRLISHSPPLSLATKIDSAVEDLLSLCDGPGGFCVRRFELEQYQLLGLVLVPSILLEEIASRRRGGALTK